MLSAIWRICFAGCVRALRLFGLSEWMATCSIFSVPSPSVYDWPHGSFDLAGRASEVMNVVALGTRNKRRPIGTRRVDLPPRSSRAARRAISPRSPSHASEPLAAKLAISSVRRRDQRLASGSWCQCRQQSRNHHLEPLAAYALKLLDRYRGIVQCDGYAAYKTIANAASDEAITLAFCWAHL
jgi:hypothetical protein